MSSARRAANICIVPSDKPAIARGRAPGPSREKAASRAVAVPTPLSCHRRDTEFIKSASNDHLQWNHIRREELESARPGGMMMYLSNQSLLIIIVVGIVAGYLAGRVMRGGGFGLIGDLVVGLIGAFIGDWLLPQLGIHLGIGIVALIINAFIGAVVLLLILRLFGGGWGGGWGRRRW
jgi:uncharacterized membrane protein YeaQ/YmgE (transglycosylase-associated protein family)